MIDFCFDGCCLLTPCHVCFVFGAWQFCVWVARHHYISGKSSLHSFQPSVQSMSWTAVSSCVMPHVILGKTKTQTTSLYRNLKTRTYNSLLHSFTLKHTHTYTHARACSLGRRLFNQSPGSGLLLCTVQWLLCVRSSSACHLDN